MRRFAALVCAISVVLVVVAAGEAEACSCAALDPLEMLEGSDAAFVGTLIERPTEPIAGGEFEGVWVFEVDEWVKGDLGSRVGVHAALEATPVSTPPTVEEEPPPVAAPSQESETAYIPMAVALVVVAAAVATATVRRERRTSLSDVD